MDTTATNLIENTLSGSNKAVQLSVSIRTYFHQLTHCHMQPATSVCIKLFGIVAVIIITDYFAAISKQCWCFSLCRVLENGICVVPKILLDLCLCLLCWRPPTVNRLSHSQAWWFAADPTSLACNSIFRKEWNFVRHKAFNGEMHTSQSCDFNWFSVDDGSISSPFMLIQHYINWFMLVDHRAIW